MEKRHQQSQNYQSHEQFYYKQVSEILHETLKQSSFNSIRQLQRQLQRQLEEEFQLINEHNLFSIQKLKDFLKSDLNRLKYHHDNYQGFFTQKILEKTLNWTKVHSTSEFQFINDLFNFLIYIKTHSFNTFLKINLKPIFDQDLFLVNLLEHSFDDITDMLKYSQIHSLQAKVLWVFTEIYIKQPLCLKRKITNHQLFEQRREIRHQNRQQIYLPLIQRVIEIVMDKYVLVSSSKWNIHEGFRIEVCQCDLLEICLSYGLFDRDYLYHLISIIYLLSEKLFEHEEFINSTFEVIQPSQLIHYQSQINHCKENLVNCLYQSFILFGDEWLYSVKQKNEFFNDHEELGKFILSIIANFLTKNQQDNEINFRVNEKVIQILSFYEDFNNDFYIRSQVALNYQNNLMQLYYEENSQLENPIMNSILPNLYTHLQQLIFREDQSQLQNILNEIEAKISLKSGYFEVHHISISFDLANVLITYLKVRDQNKIDSSQIKNRILSILLKLGQYDQSFMKTILSSENLIFIHSTYSNKTLIHFYQQLQQIFASSIDRTISLQKEIHNLFSIYVQTLKKLKNELEIQKITTEDLKQLSLQQQFLLNLNEYQKNLIFVGKQFHQISQGNQLSQIFREWDIYKFLQESSDVMTDQDLQGVQTLQNQSGKFYLYYSITYFLIQVTNHQYSSFCYNNMISSMKQFENHIEEEGFSIEEPKNLITLEIILQLYTNFQIFFNNNLIDGRLEINKMKNPYNRVTLKVDQEYIIPRNYTFMFRVIKFAIQWIDDFKALNSDVSKAQIDKFIQNGLFPMIKKFSYCSQVLIDEQTEVIDLEEEVDEYEEDTTENQLIRFQRDIFETLNQIQKLINSFDQKKIEPSSVKSQNLKINQVQPIEQIIEDQEETLQDKDISVNDALIQIFKQICRKLEKFEFLQEQNFEKNKNQFISQYLCSTPIQNDLENSIEDFLGNDSSQINIYIQSKYQFIIKKKKDLSFYLYQHNDSQLPQNIIKFLKIYLNQNQHQEDYHLFNNDIIRHFALIENLVISNKKNFIFLNNILIEEINQQILVEQGNTLLQKFFTLYSTLYQLVIYKPLQDQYWRENYWHFKILSNFMTSLCQENDLQLLSLLGTVELGCLNKFLGENKQNNIIKELYRHFENTQFITSAWKNKGRKIIKSDREETFHQISQLIQTLSSCIDGSIINNSLQIYQYSMFVWVGFLQRIIDDINSSFYQVKYYCIEYLSALLEGENSEIVSYLSNNIEVELIYKNIVSMIKKLTIYHKKKQMNKKQEKIDTNITSTDEYNQDYFFNSNEIMNFYKLFIQEFAQHIVLETSIKLFIMMKKLSFLTKFIQFYLEEKVQKCNIEIDDNQQQLEIIVFQFLQSIILQVEIQDEGFLYRVYFKREPMCYFLQEITKEQFIETFDYESALTKNQDLIEKSEFFSIEMKCTRNMFKKMKIFYKFFTKDFNLFNEYIIYFLCLLQNLLLLYTLKGEHVDSSEGQVAPLFYQTKTIFRINQTLSTIIIVYASLILFIWMIYGYPLEYRVIKEEYRSKNLSFIQKIIFYVRVYFISSMIKNPLFSNLALQIIFTLLGNFYTKWYLTFNLFLIGNMNRTVNYILKSIFIHYDKLLIALLMTVILSYLYSFILFEYFVQQVNDSYSILDCQNLIQCFINSVNIGMRMGGGLGDMLWLLGNTNESNFWARFFFDITFFLLIKQIFLNIFTGIIIDTFSEMRNELNQRSYDQENNCHICGLDKWKVQRQQQNYQKHITEVHNLWDYLYFMQSLKLRNKNMLSIIEFNVYKKYLVKNTDWFPNHVFLDEDKNIKKLNQLIGNFINGLRFEMDF